MALLYFCVFRGTQCGPVYPTTTNGRGYKTVNVHSRLFWNAGLVLLVIHSLFSAQNSALSSGDPVQTHVFH
jgi:hypothetical protein